MNDSVEMVLKVDPFAQTLRGNENANRLFRKVIDLLRALYAITVAATY